jgi:two-component system, NtrC family, response regulator AtoC
MSDRQKTVLIIDDRVRLCESLGASLAERGYRFLSAYDGTSALALVACEKVDATLLDIRLGDENGLTLLPKLVKMRPSMPVIVITGYGTLEIAIESIKSGAFDYLQKPVRMDKLLKVLANALKLSVLEEENRELRSRVQGIPFVTESPIMKELLVRAARLASSELPILICGESGTGKELIAGFIHERSARAAKPMQSVNCAAFPESLLDNELFGHERGAFTGATSAFQGVFERSQGTTLFLDEIGDMQIGIQAKILRAIQNKEIRRLGGSETVSVDLRFIAATNRDLEAQIAAGAFRSDLLYRLNTATVVVPPLRDRREDILPLARHFLSEAGPAGARDGKRFDEDAEALLSAYDWPGNVRELKSAASYAATISADKVVTPADLPAAVAKNGGDPEFGNLRESFEKNLIMRTLVEERNNKKRVAEKLAMSRATLYNKLHKYGLLDG